MKGGGILYLVSVGAGGVGCKLCRPSCGVIRISLPLLTALKITRPYMQQLQFYVLIPLDVSYVTVSVALQVVAMSSTIDMVLCPTMPLWPAECRVPYDLLHGFAYGACFEKCFPSCVVTLKKRGNHAVLWA